jgi:site-specific DNA recombinase
MKAKTNPLEQLLEQSTASKYKTQVQRDKRCGVIYTRVSAQEQESNSSLSTQKKLCEEYARRNGIIIKEYFGGRFESAKSDGRAEFQKMLTYIRKDRDISYVIVINYDRFSRTGPAAAQISASLRKQGILVKAVLQDIDTTTASGRLQENVFHVFNHFDNENKSERTSVNTREVMLKGYWPYQTPLGYKNLKPKHRAYEHQYVIAPEGKLIKKAFELKVEGVLTNKEICERLSAKGLKLTEKNIRWILSNPFYAGYVTGRLVGGKLIKGKHPALIDLKTLLKANDLLKKAVNAGVAKSARKEDLPLKIFAKDERSGSPLSGYLKKGNWYYKARAKGAGVNVSAKELNKKFEDLLCSYQYKKQYKNQLRVLLLKKLRQRLSAHLEESIHLKKRATELQGQLDTVEERYILNHISETLYEKYKEKYAGQLAEIRGELEKKQFDSSNLQTAVDKALLIAENLSGAWVTAGYDQKQRLQYLVFPDGIVYNKKKGAVRTLRANSLFSEIPLLAHDVAEKKKGNSRKNCLKSNSVPKTGFEPARR